MRVLLVEDESSLAAALASFLRGRGFVVEVAPTIMDTRVAIRAAKWASVLLDLQLPDGEGLSVLPEIRRLLPEASVIILTARDRVSDRVRGLDTGADDYLVKPFDPEELLARLRAVERRRNRTESTSINLGALEIDLAMASVKVDGEPVVLTGKEWALLRVMATRPDRIHSRLALMEALYGHDDEKGRNTLDVFMSHLRRKLGSNCIETVRGIGYRLTGNST